VSFYAWGFSGTSTAFLARTRPGKIGLFGVFRRRRCVGSPYTVRIFPGANIPPPAFFGWCWHLFSSAPPRRGGAQAAAS
jgi:hypothetical protein